MISTESEGSEKEDENSQAIAKRLRNNEPKDEQEIFKEFSKWKKDHRSNKIKIKPAAGGKNWIKISKKNIFSLLRIRLPDYNEEIWIKLLYVKFKDFVAKKNWKILKFHLEDPLITNLERLRVQDMLNFLLQTEFKEHKFFLSTT